MLPGKTYTPEDFVRIASRRKWLIIIPFVVITLATGIGARFLPDQYRSETVILVVPQQVPESYVRSTVTTRIDDRLQSISQQILSRTRLERIIQDLNLYQKERRKGIMEDVVENMRSDIKVEVLKGDAFRVTYVGDNAMTVMQVTNRLASLFIDESLKDREVMAEGTSQFLTVQLEDARQQLVQQEKKLEIYRQQHSGELPSQADSNLQMVQNTQMQIQSVLESLNRLQDRRLLVQRQLADLTTPDSEPSINAGAEPAPDAPAAEQLARAQMQLHDLQLRFKPEHPDIIKMQRIITGLQQRAEAEALTAPLSPDANGNATPAQVLKRNKIKELQQELDGYDRQIAAQKAEEARLRTVGTSYQARLEAVPARETELAELTRDYVTTQQIYSSLLAKNEESKVAANLERRQIGEQFKLLDPARAAQRPFSPNRPRITMIGLVSGLGIGLALVGFLEYRDSTFRTQDDVISVLTLPVLAQIPIIITPTEQKKIGRRRLMVSVAIGAIFIATGAAMWRLGMLSGLLR